MGLSIKQHIEAGHYPKDDKGRALVPARAGGHVVVCAVDMPGSCPILGYRLHPSGEREASQHADSGFGYYADSTLLLPPPPRKVEVKAYALVANNATYGELSWKPASLTGAEKDRFQIVTLTGSYEEPWEGS